MKTEFKQKRIVAKNTLGKYKNIEVTSKKFDCGLSDEGLNIACEHCVVCKYNNFLEFAHSVGVGQVQYDPFIDKYIRIVYESQ